MGNIHRVARAVKAALRRTDYEARKPDLWATAQERRAARLRESSLTAYERVRFRRWLWWKYGPECAYCGRGFPMEGLTIDHIQPRSKGGAVRDIHNMALACLACNRGKGDMWEPCTTVNAY